MYMPKLNIILCCTVAHLYSAALAPGQPGVGTQRMLSVEDGDAPAATADPSSTQKQKRWTGELTNAAGA
jgi:hypothetical protein